MASACPAMGHSRSLGECCSFPAVREGRAKRPLPWVVALAVFATYLVAARGPRNLFPLSVFDMYQGHASASVARVLVLDAAGEASEVDAFEDWACSWEGDALRAVEDVCGPQHRPLEYVLRDQERYIERHRGDGDQNVRLVSRAYRLERVGESTDCVVAQCRVRRRRGGLW